MTFRYQLQSINQAAAWLCKNARASNLWLLSGEMGAGKTTLVAAIARHLGILDVVSSPTYSIINRYQLPLSHSARTLYHIDLYRLNSEEEAIDAGLEECVQDVQVLTIVEWASKAPLLSACPHVEIKIEKTATKERILTLNRNI